MHFSLSINSEIDYDIEFSYDYSLEITDFIGLVCSEIILLGKNSLLILL